MASVCATQARHNHSNSQPVQSFDKKLVHTGSRVASVFLELMWHQFF